MNPVEIEDQVSITNDDGIINPGSSSTQECNLGIDNFQDFTSCGMINIEEVNLEYESVKKMFLSGLGTFAKNTVVVAIYKTLKSDSSAIKARWDSFTIFSDSVAKRREGNSNIVFAWYGGSRNEIQRIISDGFTLGFKPASAISYGVGICLYSSKLSLYGMEAADYDKDGVRHMLLCRVILGNSEVIQPGFDQFQPSSDQFDSGVDNLTDPNRYIIWSHFMNSHIFPHYVVSFKASCFTGSTQSTERYSFKQRSCRTTLRSPISRWIRFPDLLALICESLNPSKIALVSRNYNEYRANKISREQMVRVLRQIIGDRVLIHIIKAHREWIGK